MTYIVDGKFIFIDYELINTDFPNSKIKIPTKDIDKTIIRERAKLHDIKTRLNGLSVAYI